MKPQMNRRDHYIPRGYLRGFIDPSRFGEQRPLLHFDVPTGVWSARSTREVGYRKGFYDYASPDIDQESADAAFAQLESTYHAVRRRLISSHFANWKADLDFLLRYVQMMRARSLLFFENLHEEGKRLSCFTIESVSADRKSVKVRSMTPSPLPEDFIVNRTVAEMRAEIQKGAAWLNDFNWALRYCDSPADPFVIAEVPVMAFGPCSELGEALRHPDTLLIFPLCWQACLFGSRQFFDRETDRFGAEDMKRTRSIYKEKARLFVLSPTAVDL